MATLTDVQTQSDLLSDPDRKALISHMVSALKDWPLASVSDEELDEREREMDGGTIDLVSHADFKSIVLGGD